MDLKIERASTGDAEKIIELQRLCFQQEAALYNDYSIAPLKQTVAELTAEFEMHRILVARSGGEIVGSVRGIRRGDRCHIGRLIVHPSVQRRGIATRLMEALEREFADVSFYELFTGARSEGNLRLYDRLGYKETRRQSVSPNLELILLEKPGPQNTKKPALVAPGSSLHV